MAQRAPVKAATSLAKFKAVPWLLLFEAGRLAYSHVTDALSPADRKKLSAMVKRTKGKPQNLSERDRDELKRLARKLDLPGLLKALGPTAIRARTRRF